MISKSNLKVKENKSDWGLDSPRYMITYKINASEKVHRETSFEIINALKGDNDVLIEFNSSLLMLNESKSEQCADNFIKTIKSMNLNYRYRKSPSKNTKSFFAKLFDKSDKDAHEMLVYIPDEIWEEKEFNSILPADGLRYFVLNKNTDSNKILDDYFNGLFTSKEKMDLFKIIIFDCITFGQMGIVSNQISFEEFKKILGL